MGKKETFGEQKILKKGLQYNCIMIIMISMIIMVKEVH